MKFVTDTIIAAANVASDQTSDVIDLRYNYGFAIMATFTGSPSGTVKIQGSNDKITWIDIDSIAVSGTTTLSSNKDAIYWPWMKVTKAAGGTGTINVTMTLKGA